MIKIESIKENTTATINNGIPVYTGQLISHEEYSTLKVSGGSVVVSIDELEIVTINDDESEKDELEILTINDDESEKDELEIVTINNDELIITEKGITASMIGEVDEILFL